MSLFICILKDYRLIEDVLLAFVEAGVTGATMVDGRGMGQLIGSELPVFAGLRGLFPGSAADSHLVIAAVRGERLDACFEIVQRLAGPLDSPGAGIAFALPISRIEGLKSEIE